MINIELNIFFYNKGHRINFLREDLKIENIDNEIKHILTPTVDGLKSIKFRNSFKNIPGYWLQLNFSSDQKGRQLYDKLILQVPHNKIDKNVFFPKTLLSRHQLETGWINKYNFSIEDQYEDKWGIFLNELKRHMRNEQKDNVFIGLNLLLKYNPFFLKKYKRYYIFEELAYAYEQEGNIARAIKCLKLQSAFDPKSIEPYLNMSSFYIINGMEEEAIKACEAGLRNNPDDQYLISNLVIALSNIGEHEHAFIFLKQILGNDKKNMLLWKLMGDLCYEMDLNKEAIKSYKKSLNIKNENIDNMASFYAEIYNSIGACYFEEEKYVEAVKYYKKALLYNSNDTYTLLSLSQIYLYYLEDINTAFKYTKSLVKEVPDSGFGQYQLGVIYLEQGYLEKSRWHLYKARRLMPNYGPIHDAIETVKKICSAK